MPSSLIQPRNYLPRLAPAFYQGRAVIFWTHPVENRATGWLNAGFHHAFREIALHAAIREQVFCPIYTLMPDHLHLIWMSIGTASDQRNASTFLRKQLEPKLAPQSFQRQAHDHVLRVDERKRTTFAATCTYIAENPVRAGLVSNRGAWPYTGCIVPGYFNLSPFEPDYWEKFWRIYNAVAERGRLGKMNAP